MIKFFTFIFLATAAMATPAPSSPITETPANSNPPPILPTPEIPPLPSSSDLTSSYEGSFIRVIVSLLALILLIMGTFWVLKRLGRGRFGKFGSDKSIRIMERRPLSPKSVLYLIEIENKRILISESQLEVRSHISLDSIEELDKT